MVKVKTGWFAMGVVVVVAGVFVSMRRNAPAVVEIVHPKRQDVTRTLAVTGQVEAIATTVISSQLNSIMVKRVLVDKGDRVRKGQPLLEFDSRELEASVARSMAQMKQAEANVLRAKAQASGADRSVALVNQNLNDSTELKNQRDNMATTARTARERLVQSKEALKRTREGARKQAVRAAESQVRRAEIQRAWNTRQFLRTEELLKQGAVSQAEYDLAKANLENAAEAVNTAKEELSQLAEPRTEDVRQAEAAVREAEAAVQGAETMQRNAEVAYRNRTAFRLNLTSAKTEREASRASILVAEAEVLRTRADYQQAQTQLTKTVMLAPFDGVIVERQVEPGETVSSGRTLLTVVEPRNLRVRVDVDETNLKEIKTGMTAVVVPNALPNLRLEGALEEIIPTANSERGTVELRIKLQEVPANLLPRLTVDVNIRATTYKEALTLPREVVLDPDSSPRIRVWESGEIKERQIQIEAGDVGRVVVTQGLEQNASVVLRPLSASVGAKTEPKEAQEEPKR
jgi:RND family efflux transporter MFP subunit